MESLPAIRCFTCGKVTCRFVESFRIQVIQGKDPGQVMTAMGIVKNCCRRMIISNVASIDCSEQCSNQGRQRTDTSSKSTVLGVLLSTD